MIIYYFKLAWRNLTHNKLFGTVNVFGMALGLSVAILLSLFIIQERSFDTFPLQEKIYRYLAHMNDESQEIWAGVPNAIGPTVKDDLPEVKLSSRTLLNEFGNSANIGIGTDSYTEYRLYWADPDIAEIFDLQFLHGDKKTALVEPNTILLSESKAKQYFGDINPVGKTIEFNRNKTLEVVGVYADLSPTSTFDAELIGSFSSTGYSKEIRWDNASFETWVMLDETYHRQKVEEYLPKMLAEHTGEEGTYYSLSLQPLADIHLNTSVLNGYSEKAGDANQLQLLTYLAIALLLMAAINYMNLATARAQQRCKEVGVNKTLGASRGSLIGKFYAETAVLTLVSIILGLVMAIVCIPLFNALSGESLLYTTLLHPVFLIGLPALWISVTLISGLYPAVILSSYKPIDALQQGKNITIGSGTFRRVLVIVQFSTSVILIVGVIVMYFQMNYMSRQKLGYNPENVIAIKLSALKNDQEFDELQNRINSRSFTLETVLSQAFPGKGESTASIHKNDADKEGTRVYRNRIVGNIEEVLQLNLLAGRMVKKWAPADTTSEGSHRVEVVLNNYSIEYLGLTPEDAIGKRVRAGIGDHSYIVGVVDDFNFNSLHEPMGAYLFTNAPYFGMSYLLVRFSTGDLRETLQQYEAVFKDVVPGASFDYTLLDSRLENLYQADRQRASVFLAFSVLAIFVGCLGLFGLTAFTAERRTKEIGVRKVLGATTPSLVWLLSIDFIKLVATAIIIGCPIAYWGFSEWLNNFAYRVEIQWWMFGLAALAAIAVAMLTVSVQAARAATANPINSLRDE